MENQAKNKEFLVTARKWRPLKFHDVVGQQHITVTLQNAVRSGRIHHAYLFSGPRGVGKTTTARILARSINCTNPKENNEPCNECESCKAIIEGRSLDVIEIDGASNNSVEDIRKLRENSRYLPANGQYKMYIIDEVHMLSTSAFNALLKTLEEPPPHLLFVFATTEPHKVLPTILSRCQRFEFKRMEIDDIVRQLRVISDKEQIKIDENCLITIAKKGDGSMRDSQSIFDQVIAFCGNDVNYSSMADALHLVDQEFFFRITTDIKQKDLTDIFVLTKEILSKGYDLQECMEGLVEHLRNLLAVKVTDRTDLIESSADVLRRFKQVAAEFTKPDLLRMLTMASTAEHALRYAPQPRIKFETTLLQMAAMDTTLEISELISGLSDLKKNFEQGLTLDNRSVQSANIDESITYEQKQVAPAVLKEERATYTAVDNSSSNNTTATVATYGKSDITADDLRDGWKGFISKYANTEFGLSSLKSYVKQVQYFTSEVAITPVSAFIEKGLNDKKPEIIKCLSEYYRADVKITIVSPDGKSNDFDIEPTSSDFDMDDDEPEPSKNQPQVEYISPIDMVMSNKAKEIEEARQRETVVPVVVAPVTELEEKLIKLFNAQLTN